MYYFQNIDTGTIIRCEERVWLELLAAALEAGWEPEGTVYDFVTAVDETIDEAFDEMTQLYLLLTVYHRRNGWDGNYRERENQVVNGEDACSFADALRAVEVDPALLGFFNAGGFRILSGI